MELKVSFTLRDYQVRLRNDILAHLATRRSTVAVVPTGGGKTLVAAALCGVLVRSECRVMILAHRQRLLSQMAETLDMVGVRQDRVLFGSPRSFLRASDDAAKVHAIIIDEAHHSVAPEYAKVLYRYPEAFKIGFTATPQRLDGQGLGSMVGGHFDTMVQGPSVRELQDRGILVQAEVWCAAEEEALTKALSKARMTRGDYADADVRAIMETEQRIREMVTGYLKHGDNQKAVAFVTSVNHARNVAEAFVAAGIPAVATSGDDKHHVREQALNDLRTGQVQVLVSVDILGEGVDVPEIGCIILARPTASLTIYLQQVGRGLRSAPGKLRCIVLDFAGNVMRHGLPEAPREWSLDVRKFPRVTPRAMAIRLCGKCEFISPMYARSCRHCGHSFIPVTPPGQWTVPARVLSRVDPALLAARVVKGWSRVVASPERTRPREGLELLPPRITWHSGTPVLPANDASKVRGE